MKMRNLLLLGALLMTSGGMMAQTSLSTAKAKGVPGYQAMDQGAIISFKVPATIGGWQMELTLPEGLSLVENSAEITVNGEKASGSSFDGVALSSAHKGHALLGGTKSDGTVMLICFPTTTDAALSAQSGELCSIKVKADASYTGTQQVQVKNFIAADPTGSATQYTASAVRFDVIALQGDVTEDGIVNGGYIQGVINAVVADSSDEKYDANRDGQLNGGDIQQVINEIVL